MEDTVIDEGQETDKRSGVLEVVLLRHAADDRLSGDGLCSCS